MSFCFAKRVSSTSVNALSGLLALLIFTGSFAEAENNKPNIAVMSLKSVSGISSGEAILMADRIRAEFFNSGRVNVMEREQMSTILAEQGFQQSGACIDDKCMVEVGQLLGVQIIVSGSVGLLGSTYMLNLRAVDVRTGRMVASVSRDAKDNLDNLVEEIGNITEDLLDRVVEKPRVAQKTATTTVVPIINVPMQKGATLENNLNRRGFVLQYSIMWGDPVFYVNGDVKEPVRHASSPIYTTDYQDAVDFNCGPKMRVDLLYQIKCGDHIVIDLGPNFQWQDMNSVYHYTKSSDIERVDFLFVNPGIRQGIGFVTRMFPIKINAGIFGDLGLAWWNGKMERIDVFGHTVNDASSYSSSSTTSSAWTFGWGFGASGGCEYLINKHLGIRLNLLYNYARPSFIFWGDNSLIKMVIDDQTSSSDPSYEVLMPGFGLDAGVCVYF